MYDLYKKLEKKGKINIVLISSPSKFVWRLEEKKSKWKGREKEKGKKRKGRRDLKKQEN